MDMDMDKKLWRIGLAERVPDDPDDPGSARSVGRWIFMQVVAKRAPEVLMDLRRRAGSDRTGNNNPVEFVRYWNLPDWSLPYVSSTWRFSAAHPDVNLRFWMDGDRLSGALVEDVEQPAAPHYDPTIETRAAYLARVERYMDDQERAASGSVRPRKDPRAFAWLVDHLVHRKSYADIWRDDPTLRHSHRNTPRNACVELMAFLEDGKHAQK